MKIMTNNDLFDVVHCMLGIIIRLRLKEFC